MKKSIAFLDRDGVLNQKINGGYVGYKKYFKWINGAKKTIQLLKEKNFKVIVVSNQSGIARGYFFKKDVEILHRFMNQDLKKLNTKIDKFIFCPYHIDGVVKKFKKDSDLRKPNNGMFKIASKMYKIDKSRSFMIGDQKTDMMFAKKSGIKGFLFKKKNLLTFVKNIVKIYENN